MSVHTPQQANRNLEPDQALSPECPEMNSAQGLSTHSTNSGDVRFQPAVKNIQAGVCHAEPPGHSALQLIVRRMAEVSAASGAAIALDDGQGMVCRATFGNAPDVGVRVQSQSGLSGECARTGQVVHCEDSETDGRLDRALCRELKLRSVLILPLHHDSKLVGLVELFSERPGAFQPDKVELLRTMACLVIQSETRQAHQSEPDELEPEELEPKKPEPPVGQELAPAPSADAGLQPSLKLLAKNPAVIGGTAVLAVAAVLAFSAGTSSSKRPEKTTPAAAKSASAQAAGVSAEVESMRVESRPAAGEKIVKPASQKAAVEEPAKLKTSTSKPPEQESKAVQWVAAGALKPLPVREQVEPAALPSTSAELPELPQVVAVPSLPNPDTSATLRVSGILGGKVIRSVQPVYPDFARRTQLQGPVVLTAVVDREGKLKNLQAASGDPVLAAAAIAAARQWRYQPFRLGDEPIEMEVRLVFNFKL